MIHGLKEDIIKNIRKEERIIKYKILKSVEILQEMDQTLRWLCWSLLIPVSSADCSTTVSPVQRFTSYVGNFPFQDFIEGLPIYQSVKVDLEKSVIKPTGNKLVAFVNHFFFFWNFRELMQQISSSEYWPRRKVERLDNGLMPFPWNFRRQTTEANDRVIKTTRSNGNQATDNKKQCKRISWQWKNLSDTKPTQILREVGCKTLAYVFLSRFPLLF